MNKDTNQLSQTLAPSLNQPTTNFGILDTAKFADRPEFKLIKDFLQINKIATNAPEAELNYFISFCIAEGLNPLKNEVYYIPMGNKWVIMLDYKTLLARAWQSGKLIFLQTRFGTTEKGQLYCETDIQRDNMPQHATFRAYMSDFNRKTGLWNDKSKIMLEKCAIARALRMILPDIVGNFYIQEEKWEDEAPAREITIKDTIDPADDFSEGEF